VAQKEIIVGQIALPSDIWSRRLRGLRHFMLTKPLGATGVIILITAGFLAIAAPVIAPHDPLLTNADAILLSPNATYWFGTDELGRDILSRTMYGSGISMLVGIVGVLIAASAGAVIGVISAHFGGAIDLVIQRFVDGATAFPSLLLALALMAAFGPSLNNVIAAVAIVYTPRIARVVRSSALSIKETPYMEAARAIGATDLRMIARHILPNSFAPLIVVSTALVGLMIIIEASLSFLGVGTPADVISWGSMLSQNAQAYFITAPWIGIFPGAALTLVVFGMNVLGDSLRDVFDPKLRGR
jgi:peptide/nickel transport system permease protein